MKKNDVTVGESYVAKVTGKLARVRIERESPHGGWEATSVETGRRVRIKSAQRLRRAVSDAKGAKAIATATALKDLPDAEAYDAAYDPDVCATVGCGRPSALTYLGRPRCQECYEDDVADDDEPSETPNHQETDMTKAKKRTKKSATKTPNAPKATKQPKAAKPKATQPAGDAQPKRLSALDAAAEVLRKAGKPMRSQEMIAAMAEQGLWSSPAGKTPHATLYAAILREIGAKGGEARFRKSDRGLFEFNAVAAEA